MFNYGQSDLNEDDVMILDGYHTIFVWEGTNASQLEKDRALQTAKVLRECARTEISKRHIGATPRIRRNY